MFKERTLPFNYGHDVLPGHKYSSKSSGGRIAAAEQNHWDTLEVMQMYRELGIQDANVVQNEQTSDLVGYESFRSTERERPAFNNCQHSVAQGVNWPYTCALMIGSNVYVDWFKRDIPWWSYPSISKLTRHFNMDVSSAQRSAYGVMQPRFEGNISMLNFIIELKDFRSLARFLLNKPLRKLSNMARRLRRKPKFDISKPLAELHLANEFALKPLISDIVNISCQIDELFTTVQQEFADAGRERNTRHYSEDFLLTEEPSFSATDEARYPHLFAGLVESLTFTASMEYCYQYDMRSTLSAFVKYWGLTASKEAIWNALPFSFLIDYFLKVGDALAINSRDKNVLLETSQYCESFLSERTSGRHIRRSYLYGPILGCGENVTYPAPSGYQLIAGDQTTFYTRQVTSPKTGPVMPRLATPSSKQGWNMLALARCFF